MFVKNSNKVVYWYSIWKRMRNLTNKKIEKDAVFELVNYIEDHIDEIILQCMEEFQTLNRCRRQQGSYEKIMIDRYCVRNAIKNINSQQICISSNEEGGDEKEKESKEERHSQLKGVFPEVV
ncbi:MAG TPA: hypothetical protein ENI33_06510 [Thermoplasmatales archaeon]|nr:hypothetical protein [Thermoplasmatales archaeon]